MKPIVKTITFLCALAGLFVASSTLAEAPPSVWDRARDPKASGAWMTHLELQRRMKLVDDIDRASGGPTSSLRSEVAEGMRADLRARVAEARKAHPDDVSLRFDEGAVLTHTGRYADARRVLESVLADHPNHPMADDGYWQLADTCAHLRDHKCEKRLWTTVLGRWTEDRRRTTPLLNGAETEMHLGNTTGSIEMYRECIRVATRIDDRRTTLLAQWGLAVAYDRSGDALAALREASLATDLERSSGRARFSPLTVTFELRDKGVYFLPDHEIDWYEGLGAMALAKKADNDLMRLAFWRRAERSFGRYVAGAERDTSGYPTWIPIAKNRLTVSTAERIKFEKKVRANPTEASRIEETL